jgi:hypothetical protein
MPCNAIETFRAHTSLWPSEPEEEIRMKVRQLDKRPLARPLMRPLVRPLMRWFWCGMLCGAIGVATMMEKLPLLPG